ncbi:MAG: formylglycine-generating enzyme family protein [Bacteroidaceae bacterium]|nr:formylglycine-generating enzyme family protein [Bacteroidaceae bacterium]
MKTKLFVMLIALTFICPVCGQTGSTKRVAILETVDKENVISYGVKLMVRSKLAYAITNTPGYEGYDRVDVSSIMGEQEFQRTGLVSDAQIKKLGEMTGADYILVAEVAKLDNNHIIIVSKILNVETAKLEKTSNAQTATDVNAMEDACRELTIRLFGGQPGRTITLPNGYTSRSSGMDLVETVAGLNMKMVYVEGGDFLMGATSEQGSEGYDNEQVIRRVKLDSYYIGECEITQAQWGCIMGTSVQQQASKAGYSDFGGIGPEYPMYYVSWEEARAFCQELSRMTGRTYCLPTEAQWEYAARGGNKGDGTKYSGSWSIDAVAWYDGNSDSSTHPVKTKRANGLGLYDMSGNVWEWCSDWYGNSYNANDTNNPTGPSTGSGRVLRGGGWNNNARYCRVSYRYNRAPGSRFCDNGFRVVVLP